MTDISADATAVPERDPQGATAALVLLNLLMLVGLLAILWTPAVIFWVALALAPTVLVAILAITLGWLQ